jgi:hypothetical protein
MIVNPDSGKSREIRRGDKRGAANRADLRLGDARRLSGVEGWSTGVPEA